jgi:SM-20-related protein
VGRHETFNLDGASRRCQFFGLVDTMRAMRISPDDPLLLRIVDGLAERGWSQQNLFVPQGLTLELAAECRKRARAGELAPAAVGRGDAQEVREGIRGDHIQWVEPADSEPSDTYLQMMDSLRVALNRQLFLGIEEFECHFAQYPPGAFYRRHVDRFRDDDSRVVSVVLYLNTGWTPGDGGELRLYLDGEPDCDVPPVGGSLIAFLSADIPHEVLPATRERLSITGWFRRRPNELF